MTINFTTSEIQDIIRLYQEEWLSLKDIARKYSVGHGAIKSRLDQNNIRIRTSTEALWDSVDENYFSTIDSEDKAYFLGLLFADGCVLERQDRVGSKVMSIELQEGDRDILKKMRAYMKIDKKIKFFSRPNTNYQTVARLYCSSNKLCDDLIKLGCTPRKSKTLQFPTYDQVPENLMRHFIRGLFDGDGSVSSKLANHATNRHNFRVSVAGTRSICEGIKGELMKSIGLNDVKIHSQENIFEIIYCGNNSCKKIFNFLYEDSTVFLKRKYEKFDSVFRQPIRYNSIKIDQKSPLLDWSAFTPESDFLNLKGEITHAIP